MSRSSNNGPVNPCTRWFEWSGSNGKLKYWDKEKEENVFVEAPFTFLVLDQLNTVSGWSDDAQSGIWANEVRNLKMEPLTVRTRAGIAGKGLYDSVKNINGARFAKSIYIGYYDGDRVLKLGNLRAVGACLAAWIEFSRGRNVQKGAITLSGATEGKKGRNKYFIPTFEAKESVSEATEESAIALDKELQEYLNAYFRNSISEEYPEDDLSSLEIDEEPKEFQKGSVLAQFEEEEIPF
jgi:hypothetical protein